MTAPLRALLALAILLAATVTLVLRPRAPAGAGVAALPSHDVPREARAPTQSRFATNALRGPDPALALRTLAEAGDRSELERQRALVDQACRAPMMLRLEGRIEADPRRDTAVRELTLRCAWLPQPSLYVPTADTDSPLRQDESAAG